MKRMEKLLDLYRDVFKIPEIVDAWLVKAAAGDVVNVTSISTQVDILRNETTKFERNYVVEYGSQAIKPKILHRSHPVEISESLRVHSNSGNFTAVLRDIVPAARSSSSAKSNDKSQFIDIFSNALFFKESSVDLKAQEKHGKVNTGFGSLSFSCGEGHILYLAEKFRKPVAFFDPKFDEEKYQSDPSADEFAYVEPWGEQLSEVKETVICILDVNSSNITILDNVPKDISPCQPVWGPGDEGILFVGLSNLPSKLGYVACFNRKSKLFYYDIKAATCEPLTDYDAAIRHVRFSNDYSKFVYLESKVGGTHGKSEILKIYEWSSKMQITVIDVVSLSDAGSKTFPGLFDVQMSVRCWAMDNKRVLLTSTWHSKTEILVVNTETRAVQCITNKGEKYGSWQLLDVFDDIILALNSAPNRPPCLFISRLPHAGREADDLVWHKLDEDMPRPFGQLVSDISWEVLTLRRPNAQSEPAQFADIQYDAILNTPVKKSDDHCPPPLIAIPHGGPHGTCVSAWLPSVAFFVLSGYAVLRINYRGSLGFGEDFVQCLPGRVAVTDVLDCKHAVDAAVEKLSTTSNAGGDESRRQIFLYGGSHGGFLACHLIGQFPGFAKAAVAVNPVLNCASMHYESDIPDWAIVCCFGTDYVPGTPVTGEQLAVMLQKSPIHFADKVKTPLMLAVGENDLRVPCVQIKQYVKILQANNVPLKILSYPNNDHRLSKIDAQSNMLTNAMLWFENYRCQ